MAELSKGVVSEGGLATLRGVLAGRHFERAQEQWRAQMKVAQQSVVSGQPGNHPSSEPEAGHSKAAAAAPLNAQQSESRGDHHAEHQALDDAQKAGQIDSPLSVGDRLGAWGRDARIGSLVARLSYGDSAVLNEIRDEGLCADAIYFSDMVAVKVSRGNGKVYVLPVEQPFRPTRGVRALLGYLFEMDDPGARSYKCVRAASMGDDLYDKGKLNDVARLAHFDAQIEKGLLEADPLETNR